MTPEGNDTTRTPEDELLARLYQQGTDRQAARYAATYDARAGLTRFNAWLNEHTAVDPVIAAIKADAEAIPVPSRQQRQPRLRRPVTSSCPMPSRHPRRRTWAGAPTARSSNCTPNTTGRWCAWPPCWCGTPRRPRKSCRTPSWRCTGMAAAAG